MRGQLNKPVRGTACMMTVLIPVCFLLAGCSHIGEFTEGYMPSATVAMSSFSSGVGTSGSDALTKSAEVNPGNGDMQPSEDFILQDEELRPEVYLSGSPVSDEEPSGQTLRSLFGLPDISDDETEEAAASDSIAVEDAGVPGGDVTDPEEDVTDPEEDETDPEEDVTDPEEDVTDPEEDVTDPEEALELSVCIKLEALRQEFPDEKYWNNGGISDSRCKHHGKDSHAECNKYMGKLVEAEGFDMGTQCLGYAAMLSDRLFGEDAPVTLIDDFSQLRPGDHIRFVVEDEDGWTGNHSLLVLSNDGDSVTVTDCNHDFQSCMIRWDAVYTREYLDAHEHRYWTRYTVE